MARPREFDTNIAIGSICDKFWSGGYEATSITDLEEATGLARARLYAAFGSKREMLHQAIDFYLERRIKRIFSVVEGGGLTAVANFFRAFAGIISQRPEEAAMGCLLINSVVELGRSDPNVAARADWYREHIHEVFRSALSNEAEVKHLAGDPGTLADLALMMLMGLFISVKGGAPIEEVKRLCEVAINTVESWRISPEAAPVSSG